MDDVQVMASEDHFGLYFTLAEGRKADLEIVSAAAIAWVETLRAAAKAVDPESDVKVEMLRADESSLLYRTIVAWFERTIEPALDRVAKGGEKLPRTKALLLALAPFLLITGPETWQFYFGASWTTEDHAMLVELTKKIDADPSVDTAKRKFYRIVQREPAITGVGVRQGDNETPLIMVQADSFAAADGLFDHDQDVQEQITHPVMEVTLVKPALVHKPRSWTFKPDGFPEFDAVMRDVRVLHAIQEHGFPEQMREGIRMTIRLEVREAYVDGEWKLVRGGRSVTRVISPKID